MGTKTRPVRITVDLSDGEHKDLETLRASTGVASNSEAVRRALRVLAYIDDNQKRGNHFTLIENGRSTRVRFVV